MSLECSPIKFVAQKKRVSYGKWKLKEMIQATENCVADMLHIDKVVIVEQKPQCCCQDCSNLQSLMKLLKHFSIDCREKVKLLALLPNSWTTEKTMKYFSVSKRCISSARKLKKSSEIPSIIQKKTGRTLSGGIKLNIHSICSVIILQNGPRQKGVCIWKLMANMNMSQKHFLLLNLKELHIEYLNICFRTLWKNCWIL